MDAGTITDGETVTVEARLAAAGLSTATKAGRHGLPAGRRTGGGGRVGAGSFFSRDARAMLLHAFADRVRAEVVFAQAATSGPGHRFDDVAVLTAVSMVFGLGFASMEQAQHPDRAQVGMLAGITVLPESALLAYRANSKVGGRPTPRPAWPPTLRCTRPGRASSGARQRW